MSLARAANLVFYVGMSLLVAHELDAVLQHEWRLLPVLSGLDEQTAASTFILIHIPALTILYWSAAHDRKQIREPVRLGVDGFLIAHALIHLAVQNHEAYTFHPPIETITVFGGGVAGLLHAAMVKIPRT